MEKKKKNFILVREKNGFDASLSGSVNSPISLLEIRVVKI